MPPSSARKRVLPILKCAHASAVERLGTPRGAGRERPAGGDDVIEGREGDRGGEEGREISIRERFVVL